MGLDISHDAWHGGYISFMMWRKKLAEVAGLPPLEFMEGFYSESAFDVISPFNYIEICVRGNEIAMNKIAEFKKCLPIRWSILKPDVLYLLLHHSDSDGEIDWETAGELAKRLKE